HHGPLDSTFFPYTTLFRSTAAERQEGFVRNAFQNNIHGAAGCIALLVRRKGLADLDTFNRGGGKLIELHSALVGVGSRKANAVEIGRASCRERVWVWVCGG